MRTRTDLARFGVAVQDGRLLSADGVRRMWTVQPLADGSANPQNYALGWRVGESTRLFVDGRPLQVVHHGGSQAGTCQHGQQPFHAYGPGFQRRPNGACPRQ